MKPGLVGRVWFLLFLPLGIVAAPAERDLGQGLAYVRIRDLPGELPAQAGEAPRALVVDVRYVAAGRDAAAAFSAWLKFRATPKAPVLVLANRETSVELRRVLRDSHRGTGIAVVGIAGPDFDPDIRVRASPESEKRAYDAFDQGTALATLLTDHPDKIRNDEARLLRAPAAVPDEDGAGSEPTPASQVDATLQRAVHLHRSLLALRRG